VKFIVIFLIEANFIYGLYCVLQSQSVRDAAGLSQVMITIFFPHKK